MGPVQDYSRENLVHTDKAIAMARRMLHAATRNTGGDGLPAIAAAAQRVRAASVLLERSVKAPEWARESLLDGLRQPVYSV
jgi:hypothetical protein